MTLAGYIDRLAELSCDSYNEDPEGILEYVEKWEARQPKPVEALRRKEVTNQQQLEDATRETARESLAEELPEFFESGESYTARQRQVSFELRDMAKEHQQHSQPTGPSQQLHYYKLWRRWCIKHGRIPLSDQDLKSPTSDMLILLFHHAHNFEELAMVFGFRELLPNQNYDPDRELYLRYRGFVYNYERDLIKHDHEEVMTKVAEKRAQEQAWLLERRVEWCVDEATNVSQHRIDSIVSDTKEQMRCEQRQREHEAAAELAKAQRTQDYPREPPKYNYTKRDNKGPERTSSSARTANHTTHTRHASTKISGIFASLGVAIRGFVNEVVDLAGELFDGEYPGGEPK